MPYSIRKIGKNKYQVYNTATGEIHSKGTTKKKAEGQFRLLQGITRNELIGLEGGMSDWSRPRPRKLPPVTEAPSTRTTTRTAPAPAPRFYTDTAKRVGEKTPLVKNELKSAIKELDRTRKQVHLDHWDLETKYKSVPVSDKEQRDAIKLELERLGQKAFQLQKDSTELQKIITEMGSLTASGRRRGGANRRSYIGGMFNWVKSVVGRHPTLTRKQIEEAERFANELMADPNGIDFEGTSILPKNVRKELGEEYYNRQMMGREDVDAPGDAGDVFADEIRKQQQQGRGRRMKGGMFNWVKSVVGRHPTLTRKQIEEAERFANELMADPNGIDFEGTSILPKNVRKELGEEYYNRQMMSREDVDVPGDAGDVFADEIRKQQQQQGRGRRRGGGLPPQIQNALRAFRHELQVAKALPKSQQRTQMIHSIEDQITRILDASKTVPTSVEHYIDLDSDDEEGGGRYIGGSRVNIARIEERIVGLYHQAHAIHTNVETLRQRRTALDRLIERNPQILNNAEMMGQYNNLSATINTMGNELVNIANEVYALNEERLQLIANLDNEDDFSGMLDDFNDRHPPTASASGRRTGRGQSWVRSARVAVDADPNAPVETTAEVSQVPPIQILNELLAGRDGIRNMILRFNNILDREDITLNPADITGIQTRIQDLQAVQAEIMRQINSVTNVLTVPTIDATRFRPLLRRLWEVAEIDPATIANAPPVEATPVPAFGTPAPPRDYGPRRFL